MNRRSFFRTSAGLIAVASIAPKMLLAAPQSAPAVLPAAGPTVYGQMEVIWWDEQLFVARMMGYDTADVTRAAYAYMPVSSDLVGCGPPGGGWQIFDLAYLEAVEIDLKMSLDTHLRRMA